MGSDMGGFNAPAEPSPFDNQPAEQPMFDFGDTPAATGQAQPQQIDPNAMNDILGGMGAATTVQQEAMPDAMPFVDAPAQPFVDAPAQPSSDPFSMDNAFGGTEAPTAQPA